MPVPDLTPQDDLMIAVALSRFASQFEDADPQLSDRAWEVAVRICDQHGLEPAEAVLQLDSSDPRV